jgi:hypothetical protein
VTNVSEIEPPRIYPTLRCRDAEAMIRWLIDVIGFTEYVFIAAMAWCNTPSSPLGRHC